MDDKELLGPPELPSAKKPEQSTEAGPHLQLVNSTRSTIPVSEVDDEEAEPDTLNEHVEEPGDPDGVLAAEQDKVWHETHPAPELSPAVAVKRKRRWHKVLLVAIIIAAAAVGAYWFGNHKASAPPTNQSQSSQSPKKQSAQTKTIPTKHYDSVTYTLGFDYPQDWAVSDATTKLTVTSPPVQLTGVDGAKGSDHVVVTIQNQQTTLPGYPAGGAIAELSSDKLTYKQPTSVQRTQTYLSYLGYHKTNGLDQLFITGDNGYQQGQQVPMSDIVKGNPLVSVSFETCSTADCNNGTTALVTLLASDWKATAVNKQVTDLLQSMQLD